MFLCSLICMSVYCIAGTCLLKVSCAFVVVYLTNLYVSPVVSFGGGWVGSLFCEL